MALLELAFQAVAVASLAPIRRLPEFTSLTTKAVTMPSTSPSSPVAKSAASEIVVAESSLPVATGPENWVSVGGSFTALTEISTFFVAVE